MAATAQSPLLSSDRRSLIGLTALAMLAFAGNSLLCRLALRDTSIDAGALLLFGSVQVTMIAVGLFKGERFRPAQLAGFVLACAGLPICCRQASPHRRRSALHS